MIVETSGEADPDWQALSALAAAFYDGLYAGAVNAAFLPLPTAAVLGVTRFVARRDGEALGCAALVQHEGGSGEIKRLFVRQEARGAGVGGLLLDAVERRAAGRGLARLQLETSLRLAAATALYLRRGYRVGARFGDYPDHPDSLFLERELAAADGLSPRGA